MTQNFTQPEAVKSQGIPENAEPFRYVRESLGHTRDQHADYLGVSSELIKLVEGAQLVRPRKMAKALQDKGFDSELILDLYTAHRINKRSPYVQKMEAKVEEIKQSGKLSMLLDVRQMILNGNKLTTVYADGSTRVTPFDPPPGFPTEPDPTLPGYVPPGA